jgi:tRNA G10  N-methylase Trm11
MVEYLFVFGRNPILSFAEIVVYLNSRGIKFKVKERENNCVLISLEKIDIKKIMHDLGGTVKIVEVLFEGRSLNEILEEIKRKQLIEWMNEKFCFSLNFYGKEFKGKYLLEEFFKRKFREQKKKAVYKKGKNVNGSSPTQVHSLNLIQEKSDFVFFNSSKFYFGLTVECFNPKELKKRDKSRPEQKKLHSISLRLARILINLSGIKEKETLLDPFCGIGTILQEAMFNGMNVIGIELSEETARKARRNLQWFEKNYKTGKKWKVIQGDSAFIKETLQGKKFDAVASEPFLGPLLKKTPTENEAKKIIKELNQLYFSFFRKLALITRKQKIAIILPLIKCSNGKEIRLTEKVFSSYFKSVNPIQEFEKKAFPFSYMEEESIIGRKIYLLERASSKTSN